MHPTRLGTTVTFVPGLGCDNDNEDREVRCDKDDQLTHYRRRSGQVLNVRKPVAVFTYPVFSGC